MNKVVLLFEKSIIDHSEDVLYKKASIFGNEEVGSLGVNDFYTMTIEVGQCQEIYGRSRKSPTYEQPPHGTDTDTNIDVDIDGSDS